jgi:hypothetical protein
MVLTELFCGPTQLLCVITESLQPFPQCSTPSLTEPSRQKRKRGTGRESESGDLRASMVTDVREPVSPDSALARADAKDGAQLLQAVRAERCMSMRSRKA